MPSTEQILKDLIAIRPGNRFLEYVVDRIQDNDYRGVHISQHNRFDLSRLTVILGAIYKIVGDKPFRIPLGDDHGSYRDPDCGDYYQIVVTVKSEIHMGTVNSLKKNFFVDFEGMELLERFDTQGNTVSANRRSSVYSARLTAEAVKLAQSTSLVEKYRIFTNALDHLFADEITNLAETLYYSNYRNDCISIYEFMLILSDDRPDCRDRKIDLIDSYRSLEKWQRNRVLDLVKEYCSPRNFIGNKTQKRDFGNWKNEAQQIFTLLKNTVYFDITQNSLRLNTGKYGIFEESQVKQRGQGAKQDYFRQHRLERKEDCELHHFVEFSSARNKEEFRLIDNWKNLIYLDKDKHAEITRHRNRHKVLTATASTVFLNDYEGNQITAENGCSAFYDGSLAPVMQKYNRAMLSEMFGYVLESRS